MLPCDHGWSFFHRVSNQGDASATVARKSECLVFCLLLLSPCATVGVSEVHEATVRSVTLIGANIMPTRLIVPARKYLLLIFSGGLAFSSWKWYLGSEGLLGAGTAYKGGDNFLGDDNDNYDIPENLQDPSFQTIAESKCHGSNQQAVPSLITLVLSAPSNDIRRNAIRESWGPDVNAIFLIGSSTETQEVLQEEAKASQDILFVPGLTNDTYSAVTFKTTFGLRWARAYCARRVQFLLKVDDDSFINALRLRSFIAGLVSDGLETAMYGMKAFGWAPHREPSSKYYLPESIYPLPYLPDYLTGPAYLMTTDLIQPLLEAHAVHMEKNNDIVFPLEDVYVTGILTRQMGFDNVVDRTDLFPNQFVPPSRVCPILGVISIHRIKPKWHKKLHEALQTASGKCQDLKGFLT